LSDTFTLDIQLENEKESFLARNDFNGVCPRESPFVHICSMESDEPEDFSAKGRNTEFCSAENKQQIIVFPTPKNNSYSVNFGKTKKHLNEY
jgi:hypothetical protein